MNRSLAAFLILLASVALTTIVHSQTSAFTYQGQLTENGTPANSSFDLVTELWNAPSGGAPVGTAITNTAVAVSNGLFTVALDFGPGVFDGGDRWLEIGVATNGGGVFATLSPRQPLTSAPYAVRAANAASAASVAAGNISGALGTAQIPNLDASKITSGTLEDALLPTNVALRSGGNTFDGTQIFNTNVGIGTTVPAAALDVQGAVRVGTTTTTSTIDLFTAPFAYGFTHSDGNRLVGTYVDDGGGWFGTLSADPLNFFVGNGFQALTINTNENVGIGTATPSSKLDVNGTVTAAAFVGNGSGLTGLNAANITGTLGTAQLPPTVITNGASRVNINGTFGGDGSAITNVDLLSVDRRGAIAFMTNRWGDFVLSSSPKVGLNPLSVVAADINGDGQMDLISANSGNGSGNTLSVLTNNGRGGFVLSSTPTVGSAPQSVAAADIDGDGNVDLISANRSSDTLTVLTNNGGGGFVLSSSPTVGSCPVTVVAADVNGDGHVDLIDLNVCSSTLSVMTNDGSGGFVLSSSPGVGSIPYSVTAADVNSDGHVDLISADYDVNTLTVLTNDGSGGFVRSSPLVVTGNPYSITAADVNGDGQVDLISANFTDGTLSVLFNTPAISGRFNGDGSGLTDLNAANITGALGAAQIPDLDAAKITSGTFATARIPSLDAGIITSGTFTTARIPNLDASKITSGTLGAAQIPNLDASKITTGTLSDARLSTNVALLDRASQAFSGTNTFAGRVGIGTTNPQVALHVVGPIIANGDIRPLGITMPGGFGADGTYVGTAGNYIAFAHPGVSEDFIGYKGNTFYMKDSPGGGDTADPNLVVGGDVSGKSFITTSDRNAKENFNAISPADVLAKVMGLPIQQWNFKTDAQTTHIGPMAQDFFAAFGVGPDDKHIATVDADGVALAAIQGLNQKPERENVELRKELQEIKQLLSNLTTKGNNQ